MEAERQCVNSAVQGAPHISSVCAQEILLGIEESLWVFVCWFAFLIFLNIKHEIIFHIYYLLLWFKLNFGGI